jgi:hypothetical protein
MPSLRIDRRAFLTGLGGATVALPFLEAMLPRNAWALGAAPKRYVAMFAGIEQKTCVPSGAGAGYTMPAGFASLESVQQHISIVSGLEIPQISAGASAPPPGGKANPHHTNIMMPLLTGYRSSEANYGVPSSASADQIAAQVHGADTRFTSLEFRAQPVGYRGGSAGVPAQMSYAAGGAAKVPQPSPQLAYESVFTGFTPPDATPADLEAQQKLLERRISVLDLVQERGQALVSRVSRHDRVRLERHFDEIRSLEHRLAELPPPSGTAECGALADPGSDPSQSNHGNTEHGGSTGYSDEDKRGSLFVDLIHMALTCDLTRVATLMLTNEQSMMSIEPLWGLAYEMHDLTHVDDLPNGVDVWNEVTSWHASFFADLVQKLVDTPEGTGGTMLDSTVVVLTNSGGPSGHGSTNMAMPIAGMPSVLRMGEHVVHGGHPAHVFQTALHAVGIDQDFGEVPGTVQGLLV